MTGGMKSMTKKIVRYSLFTLTMLMILVLLVLVGVGSAIGYLTYRYEDTSRSADYTDKQRVSANQEMTALVLEKTDDWDSETVVCIVDSAYRPMFGEDSKTTDYTVSVYVLDKEAFDKGVAETKDSKEPYTMDTLWLYSKSGPSKDKYKSLIKVATVTYEKVEKTGEIQGFTVKTVE